MPFIILDRDGVINHDPVGYIRSPDDWHPIAGSLEAIARLNRAGYRVLVASNQSGIGRGFYDVEALDRIHAKLFRMLDAVQGSIEEIFYCPHHPEDQCECRKPRTGMFVRMQEKYPINFKETVFIGDSIGDIRAAEALGCQPILVLTGHGQKTIAEHPDLVNVQQFADLATAVDAICANS